MIDVGGRSGNVDSPDNNIDVKASFISECSLFSMFRIKAVCGWEIVPISRNVSYFYRDWLLFCKALDQVLKP